MATAAQLGKLKVDLVLDRAAFQRGIDQARSGIQKFSDTVSKRLGAIGNIPGLNGLQEVLSSAGKGIGTAVATGAAVAGAALAGLSISAINTAADLKNLSTISNAAPAEFQAWAAGAKTVGIEQDKLADIFKDMNDRVGDFIATGGGPMADFFERIGPKVGVTAEQFRNLSGPQALQLYVDSLEKANVNQQDFTFFMEAIAGDSTALLPLLKNGGKAMQEYAARTAALGGIMSTETVNALAGMKTSLSEVGVVMRGLRNEMGAAFAPIVQSLAQTFVSLMTKGSALRMVIDALIAVVRVVAQVFSEVVTVVSAVAAALWEATKAAAAAIDKATGLVDAFRWLVDNSPIGWIIDLVSGFAKLIEAQGGLGGAIKALGQLASAVWSAMVASANAIPPGLEAVWNNVKAGFFEMVASLSTGWATFISTTFAGLSDTMPGTFGIVGSDGGDAIKALQESGVKAEAAAKAAAAHAEAQVQSANAAAIVQAAWAPVGDLWESLTATTEEATSALGDGSGTTGGGLASAADKAGKSAGGAKQKMSELQTVLKSLREEAAKLKATLWMSETDATIWDNLNKAKVSASSASGKEIANLTRQIEGMKQLKSATEEWRDTVKSAFTDFVAKGASFRDSLSNIIAKLAEMVASVGFDSIWKGLGGDAMSGSFLSWIGIGANANGTPNWRGGMTRVNERGGEILNLPKGTQIIPNDISKRMADQAANSGGGGHVSIGFDQSTGSLTATMTDIAGNVVAQAAPSLVGASVKQVAKSRRASNRFLR